MLLSNVASLGRFSSAGGERTPVSKNEAELKLESAVKGKE
jgi:hypothetical protein